MLGLVPRYAAWKKKDNSILTFCGVFKSQMPPLLSRTDRMKVTTMLCALLPHLSPQLSSRIQGQTELHRVGLGSQLSLVVNTWETTPTHFINHRDFNNQRIYLQTPHEKDKLSKKTLCVKQNRVQLVLHVFYIIYTLSLWLFSLPLLGQILPSTHSQMGGPPLREKCVINPPPPHQSNSNPYSLSLSPSLPEVSYKLPSLAALYKQDRSGYASPSLSANEAASEP